MLVCPKAPLRFRSTPLPSVPSREESCCDFSGAIAETIGLVLLGPSQEDLCCQQGEHRFAKLGHFWVDHLALCWLRQRSATGVFSSRVSAPRGHSLAISRHSAAGQEPNSHRSGCRVSSGRRRDRRRFPGVACGLGQRRRGRVLFGSQSRRGRRGSNWLHWGGRRRAS